MAALQENMGYVLDTCLRSTYIYNSILLNVTQRLEKIEKEVYKMLIKSILKIKEKRIGTKMIPRLEALFHIIPAKLKLMKEARMFIMKMRAVAKEDAQTCINTTKLRSHAEGSCGW